MIRYPFTLPNGETVTTALHMTGTRLDSSTGLWSVSCRCGWSSSWECSTQQAARAAGDRHLRRHHTVHIAREFLANLAETHAATSVRAMMTANRRAGHYWFETRGETRKMVAPGVVMARRREEFSSHAADWYVFAAFDPDAKNRAYASLSIYGDGTPEGDILAADRARRLAAVIRAAHGDEEAPNRAGLVDQLVSILADDVWRVTS